MQLIKITPFPIFVNGIRLVSDSDITLVAITNYGTYTDITKSHNECTFKSHFCEINQKWNYISNTSKCVYQQIYNKTAACSYTENRDKSDF